MKKQMSRMGFFVFVLGLLTTVAPKAHATRIVTSPGGGNCMYIQYDDGSSSACCTQSDGTEYCQYSK